MADEPTSADPDALGNLVDTGSKLRGELNERAAELDALVRWVEAGSPEFGVPGMQALVDRLTALGVQWERTDAGVAAVRDALLAADQGGAGRFPVVPDAVAAALVDLADGGVVDELTADLVGRGLTEELAGVIAAQTIRLVAADPSLSLYEALRRASAMASGVSEDELDRRGRAFGLSRAQVATVVADHWDEAERASGGHGVTRAGLRAVAADGQASSRMRDAAYRLASDPGLFNDLDTSARTRGVTATGYDWSQADGIIGRSDLDGFAVRDGQIRVVLPWRLLIESAGGGFRISGADGIIRGQELERFVHDRRVPAVVRRAAWELYAATDPDLTRGLRPFEPDDSERDDNGLLQAASRGLVGTLPAGAGGRSTFLTTGRGGPGGGPGAEPIPAGPAAPGGGGGAGFAGLLAAVAATVLEPVVDAGVDQATAAWDRARAPGVPGSFVVFDPDTGQPVQVSAEALARLSGDEAVTAVFWAAAGRPVGAGGAPPPIPDGAWVDETGVWRNGATNRPLAAVLTGGGPDSAGRAPLRDPNQYEDLSGELRWVDTNELVSQRPNRDWYQDDAGVWRWSDTRQPVDVPPTLAKVARALTSSEIGALREQRVAELTGGTVQGEPGGPGLRIVKPGVGASDVDVIGPNGEYIAVGGPAKARKLSQLPKTFDILRYAAQEAGVRAIAYFDEGTPEPVLAVARRVLGDSNVIVEKLLP